MGYPESRSFDSLMAEARGPLLSGEEERELSALALAGDEAAAAKLCAANIRFAVMIAKGYHAQCDRVPLEDLIAAGCYGMMLAARKFDASKSRFVTYASYWVKQKCQEEINNFGAPVRCPAHVTFGIRAVREWYGRPENCGRRKHIADADQIAEDAGITRYQATLAIINAQHHNSLDQELNYGDFPDTKKDRIVSHYPTPEEDTCGNEVDRMIDEMMALLPAREARVIRRYFLDGDEANTLESIGKEIGVSREMVRLLKERALEKLRKEWGGTLQFAALD